MINISFGFTLSDRKFYFIPKFFNVSVNKTKSFIISWLTFELRIDNSNLHWYAREKCYQLGYTMLFDSYTKSSELVDIVNENEDFVTTAIKLSDYVEATGLCSDEKDENGLHIVMDGPGQSYWEEQKIKNIITKMHFEREEQKLREENQRRNGVNV